MYRQYLSDLGCPCGLCEQPMPTVLSQQACQKCFSRIVYLLLLTLVLSSPGGVGSTVNAGNLSAGTYHPALIDKRWFMVAPDGTKLTIRAVSLVDSQQFGDAGGYQSYDAVYLSNSHGTWSSNLADAGRSGITAGIVNQNPSATLKDAGDSIYFGTDRFMPDYSYFWLKQPGREGRVLWEYSTPTGWRLINSSGKPAHAVKLDSDEQYSMNVGGYIGPDVNGFGVGNNPNANKITWWDMTPGFPKDFQPQTLPCDHVKRYYIRGIVTKTFSQAPIMSQLYERATLTEAIQRKYGPAKDSQAIFVKWADAIGHRLRTWGFNATGQYSYRYWAVQDLLNRPLPIEPNWMLANAQLGSDPHYHIKNVYSGAVCPPGSDTLRYQGTQPDPFEPNFASSLSQLVAARYSSPFGKITASAGAYALIPEEADFLFGLNKVSHDHLGYVVLSQNPYQAEDRGSARKYADPVLHAKCSLRDFLRNKYGSIDNLNAAWGTAFTTWQSSSGKIEDGTNAYSWGTGFMDEDGRHVLADRACRISFSDQFTNPDRPLVRKDLDEFVAFFAETYARDLAAALEQHAHPPVFVPLYNAPLFVYRQFAPFVDGFWVTVHDPRLLVQIYDIAHKPLIVADYSTANPDSEAFFNAKIVTVTFDKVSHRTIIRAPGLHYMFRSSFPVEFPDSAIGLTPRCKFVNSRPRPAAAHWDELELDGDYSACVAPDNYVRLYFEKTFSTQEERGEAIVSEMRDAFGARGSDGVAFVLGFEHWSLYDDSASNWGEVDNFGLATLQDNAYDGKEAIPAMGHDQSGAVIGGEEGKYGDLLSILKSGITHCRDCMGLDSH